MREGWKQQSLLELVVLQNGYPFKPSDLGDEGLPVVRIRELMDPGIPMDCSTISIPQTMRIESGDTIFSWSGRLEAVVWDRGPALLNQHLFKVTPQHPGVLKEFVLPMLQNLIPTMHVHGSTMKHITKRELSRVMVPLPPIEEQRRIVDLMGHIDAMIHATTLSLDALRASREAALSDWIPLVPESGTPLSSVSTITDCEHKTAPTAKEHESVAGRVIGTPAIRDGRIISAEARPVSAATYSEWTGRRVPHQGDVVLTREAPVGQAALIREEHGPLCLGQRTVLLSPGSSYDSAFLLSLLMSPAYQRWLRGASVSQTVERINVKRLSEMPVPQLPVEAQRAVGAQLEAMLEAEDRGVDEIERLRALRAACLSALVTGSHEIPSAYDEFLSDEGWRDGVR